MHDFVVEYSICILPCPTRHDIWQAFIGFVFMNNSQLLGNATELNELHEFDFEIIEF